jgi:hypothetical protein
MRFGCKHTLRSSTVTASYRFMREVAGFRVEVAGFRVERTRIDCASEVRAHLALKLDVDVVW